MFRHKAKEPLDSIGIRAGTDKSRLRQNYLVHYERMLERFRDRPITLLEIGVHNGASLRVWEQYFKSASIVGVDIEPKSSRFVRERVQIEIGSQFDADFLAALSRKYQPEVIIDDGSHIDEHQIFSFEHLFGCVRPGGIYIVEDLGPPPESGPSAAEYFEQLHRRLPKYRNRGEASVGIDPAEISHMEMIPGAVAIWKQLPAVAEDLAALEEQAGQSELPETLIFLAGHIRRTSGPLERALAAARRASEAVPQNPWMHLEIGKILVEMERVAEALVEVDAAIRLANDPEREALFRRYRAMLERMQQRGGKAD